MVFQTKYKQEIGSLPSKKSTNHGGKKQDFYNFMPSLGERCF